MSDPPFTRLPPGPSARRPSVESKTRQPDSCAQDRPSCTWSSIVARGSLPVRPDIAVKHSDWTTNLQSIQGEATGDRAEPDNVGSGNPSLQGNPSSVRTVGVGHDAKDHGSAFGNDISSSVVPEATFPSVDMEMKRMKESLLATESTGAGKSIQAKRIVSSSEASPIAADGERRDDSFGDVGKDGSNRSKDPSTSGTCQWQRGISWAANIKQTMEDSQRQHLAWHRSVSNTSNLSMYDKSNPKSMDDIHSSDVIGTSSRRKGRQRAVAPLDITLAKADRSLHRGMDETHEAVSNIGSAQQALRTLTSEGNLPLDEWASWRLFNRGFENPGNLCFVNAVVQVLMSSALFQQLIANLIVARRLLDSRDCPVLCAVAAISSELFGAYNSTARSFQRPIQVNHKEDTIIRCEDAVKSSLVVPLVEQFTASCSSCRSNFVCIQQEDADEFLMWLLDSMHRELLLLIKNQQESRDRQVAETVDSISKLNLTLTKSQNSDSYDDDGWLVKRGKRSVKKKVVGAVQDEEETWILKIFQCKFASAVACTGVPPSVTICPEFRVSLPISDNRILSIEDALDAYTSSEHVSGYKPREDSEPCEASKSLRFERLPKVLLLHLMRFEYTGSSGKIGRYVKFDEELAIRSAWLSPGSHERGSRYRLIGTLSHHGRAISSGHYTADVLQADGKWLRFDDNNVFRVSQETILRGTPYVLIYERLEKHSRNGRSTNR